MRNYAWVWLLGCVAWMVDTAINIAYRNPQHAALALIMAVLFGIAYAFYRIQGR
jgi:hypothetical protein